MSWLIGGRYALSLKCGPVDISKCSMIQLKPETCTYGVFWDRGK